MKHLSAVILSLIVAAGFSAQAAHADHQEPVGASIRTEHWDDTTCLKLFWTTPQRCAMRPHHYILGARVSLSKIRWRHWGKRRAIGIGRFYVGASWGDPDGSIGPTKARVVLSRPVNCFNRYRTFGRMTVKYGEKFGKKAYRGSIYEPCVLW